MSRGLSFGAGRLLAFAVLALCACQPQLVEYTAHRPGEGELLVYLQPAPRETRRLRFRLDSVAAVRDGESFPLALSLAELDSGDLPRQRLLAAGRLPAGSYPKLLLTVSAASVSDHAGSSTPAETARELTVQVPVHITEDRAVVLWLTLGPGASDSASSRFDPELDAEIPARPVSDLTGYVTNSGSDDITVFDKRSGLAVAAVMTGTRPRDIVLDSLRRTAYVALSGDDAAVDVVDLTAGAALDRILLNAGDEPTALALSRNGETLICANAGSDSVSFIDTGSLTERNRVSVGEGPGFVMLSHDGASAYVLNEMSSSISVLDVESESVTASISVEQGPWRAGLSAGGDRLYVIHRWSPYLLSVDTSSLDSDDRAYFGMGLSSIAVDQRSDSIYVGMHGDSWIQESTPLSLSPTPAFEVSGGIDDMAIDDEENNIYLLSADKRSVDVVNLTTKRALARIDVGADPFAVAVMQAR